ncbi:MAG: class I mannose-6-phosphate isomerase [Flavobacteriaceae bacterium]|nr:class I mannose-6-phosphate isomerase [Flavobacteriaceae bacterium]
MQRQTKQYLAPVKRNPTSQKYYDIFPSYSSLEEKIFKGYSTLIDEIHNEKYIILDGYIGVDWQEIIDNFTHLLENKGKKVSTISIIDCLQSEKEIQKLVSPFLGGSDPVFGKRTTLNLIDFFNKEKLKTISEQEKADIKIIYGTGASLTKEKGCLIYFDIPKNELQYRMRSESFTNIGHHKIKDPKQMYKHLYFVDWIVLNKEKKRLLPKIDIIVDQQRPENPVWMYGEGMRNTLDRMSENFFRVRPWFEPGVWGGQWMKSRFHQLNKDVPNYAWSFEMIVPENGLMLEYHDILLELSFDMLMFHKSKNVLGKAYKRFKDEFPIRFDFLDTYDGGNLSVQCHPKTEYIQKEFGENFTQDETYYILDAEKDATVYLGFQENITPEQFKKTLNSSFETKKTIDIEHFIQKLPAKKHDLFLIPNGTVHCSGINNMVLEISATPYIYTFKMYDWKRLDLDGNTRPLNINRAFKNLDFNRKGSVVQKTLISKPKVTENGSDWKKIHLPTHKEHFYDIYRYEFDTEIEIQTQDQCHILMLVEGESVELISKNGEKAIFNYAETFAVPAAAKKYKIVNKGYSQAKLIVSFVKDEAC